MILLHIDSKPSQKYLSINKSLIENNVFIFLFDMLSHFVTLKSFIFLDIASYYLNLRQWWQRSRAHVCITLATVFVVSFGKKITNFCKIDLLVFKREFVIVFIFYEIDFSIAAYKAAIPEDDLTFQWIVWMSQSHFWELSTFFKNIFKKITNNSLFFTVDTQFMLSS